MEIRLDLHIHSAASFDGRMTLAEIAALAKQRGLQAVAVCDHDVFTVPPETGEILFIPGCEFSTEYGHLLGLFLKKPIENQGFFAVCDAIHAQGGLAVLAHPFEHRRDAAALKALVPYLDGAEIWNSRADRKNRTANAQAKQFAAEHRLLPFGGSDAHLPEEVGGGVMTLEVPALTLEAVQAALRRGEIAVSGVRGRSMAVARSQYTKLKRQKARPRAYLKWLLFAGKCWGEDLRRKLSCRCL